MTEHSINRTPPSAWLIAVGNELLTGEVVDTNSSYIAGRLHAAGFQVVGSAIVPDKQQHICSAIAEAVGKASLVIMTGGLGPTSDDLTRYAVGDFLGVQVVQDGSSLLRITERLRLRNKTVSVLNERQTYFPEGAKVVSNDWGTADAFISRTCGDGNSASKLLVNLPGVPYEMKNLFSEKILPELCSVFAVSVSRHTHLFRTFGIAESEIGEGIELLRLPEGVEVAYRPSFPEVRVKLSAHINAHMNACVDTRVDAQVDKPCDPRATEITGAGTMGVELTELSQFEEAVIRVREVLGDAVFIEDASDTARDTVSDTMGSCVVALLQKCGHTVAAAESCTGGLIADALVSVPGASTVFNAGVVSYSNDAKENLLGVSHLMLADYGAVSAEVAVEMALQVRIRTGSDWGISTTGIAGPAGGSPEKPVGTLWIGLSGKDGEQSFYVDVKRERNMFRIYGAWKALDILRRELYRVQKGSLV